MCQCGGNCSSGCTTLKGDVGTPGSVWYNGIGVPSPSLGIVGDYYLDTATGNVYHKTATATWALQGNIKGATGSAGAGGAIIKYNDWQAVANTSGVLQDLKTTGTPISILNDGDMLEIETGFTVLPNKSTPLVLYLYYGAVLLHSGVYSSVLGQKTVTWKVSVTRMGDLLVNFNSHIQNASPIGIVPVNGTSVYFTTSAVAISSLTTGSIIKTRGDGTTANDIVCQYLKVTSYTK